MKEIQWNDGLDLRERVTIIKLGTYLSCWSGGVLFSKMYIYISECIYLMSSSLTNILMLFLMLVIY